MKKTIVHLSTYLQGGAGRIISDLITLQADAGHEVACVINQTEYEGYQSYAEYKASIASRATLYSVDNWFKRDMAGILDAALLLKQILEPVPHCIVHSHAAVPAFAAQIARGMLKADFPIVQTVHGWGLNKTAEQSAFDVKILSSLDAVVAVSSVGRCQLIDLGVPEHLLSVIPNGICSATACIESSNPVVAKIKQIKSSHDCVIACVGTLCERKAQSDLVAAVRQLRQKGVNVGCVLIGECDNSYAKSLIEVVENDPAIHSAVYFMGCVDRAGEVLSEFDALVSTSHSEGLPLAVLEAMRESVPVILSDIPEHREVVTNAVTGWLFTHNEINALSGCLGAFLCLDAQVVNAVVSAAHTTYEQHYDSTGMYDAYEQLYGRLS